jgi:hypothetical protein
MPNLSQSASSSRIWIRTSTLGGQYNPLKELE